MTAPAITAAAAGTWTLGDLMVNRIGFGAMRLPQQRRAFAADAAAGDRSRAIATLRRAVEQGVNHISAELQALARDTAFVTLLRGIGGKDDPGG